MDTLAAQLMYSLQRGQVEVVVAIYILLEGLRVARQNNALIMGVHHKLELRQFFESARRRQATSDAQPWRRADDV